MKIYRSGLEFEDAIFGRHSSGDKLIEKFLGAKINFDKDIRYLIRNTTSSYPNTIIGQLLFGGVEKELRGLKLDVSGFKFVSAIDTKVDLRHFADGLFYLPSVPRFPTTIDTFNIDPAILVGLRDRWIDSFSGSFYSEYDFQTDLFRFKKGALVIKRNGDWKNRKQFKGLDPREYATGDGRPENHFILTPSDVGTYEGRRRFVKLIAGYFAKVAKGSNYPNMALQSP